MRIIFNFYGDCMSDIVKGFGIVRTDPEIKMVSAWHQRRQLDTQVDVIYSCSTSNERSRLRFCLHDRAEAWIENVDRHQCWAAVPLKGDCSATGQFEFGLLALNTDVD